MKFGELISVCGELPWFDVATVMQVTNQDKAGLRTQLHRWTREGRLIRLRRGMYTFTAQYRKANVHPAVLANEMYRPSYLTGIWALSYFGLIPEKAARYTSVTPRVPRTFTNHFGSFHYSNIKQSYFFGFKRMSIEHAPVWLAEPEKALLDLWHLSRGKWSPERMTEMRFQNFDLVNVKKLERYAKRFNSPRLLVAVLNWRMLSQCESKGTVTL